MKLNRSDMAAAAGVQPATLDAWVREGCPIENRPGQGKAATFDAPSVVAWITNRAVGKALDRAERQADPAEMDMLRARRLQLEVERRELELARARGDLAPVSEIAHLFGRLILAVRSDLMTNIPARVAHELETSPTAQIRATVTREMRNGLDEFSQKGIMTAFAEAGLRLGVGEVGRCDDCRRVVELIEAQGGEA